ncbi:MAG: NADH-quinone oxidoreductase subunit NuoE [Candidatus Omnitrophica bacterium]|nr:NADH-quinone oxidoreductase subunit NuoE [Candidatus Omnitrophota bacterium]
MAKVCAVPKKIIKDGKEVMVCDETRSRLLPVLQSIQDKEGYISDKNMQEVADMFGIHPVEVFSVITFYSFLSEKKKGKHIIRVSNCVSNVMAGSEKVINEFEKALKIKTGQTTKDGKFTLERTSCIGMCDEAPAVMVDDKLIGKVTPQKVKKIIQEQK